MLSSSKKGLGPLNVPIPPTLLRVRGLVTLGRGKKSVERKEMADVPKMSEEEICSVSFQRTIKRIRKNSAEPKNKLNIRDVHRRSAPPLVPSPTPPPAGK